MKLDLKDDEAVGAEIILRAVFAPVKQIAQNAGFDAGVVANEIAGIRNQFGDCEFGLTVRLLILLRLHYLNNTVLRLVDPNSQLCSWQ